MGYQNNAIPARATRNLGAILLARKPERPTELRLKEVVQRILHGVSEINEKYRPVPRLVGGEEGVGGELVSVEFGRTRIHVDGGQSCRYVRPNT